MHGVAASGAEDRRPGAQRLLDEVTTVALERENCGARGGYGAQRVLDEVDGDAVLVAEGRVETDDELARRKIALGVDLHRCMYA